jgi:chromosome segregation ATPase
MMWTVFLGSEEKGARLQEVDEQIHSLNAHVQNVETEAREANKQVQTLLAKEQELTDKNREQVIILITP